MICKKASITDYALAFCISSLYRICFSSGFDYKSFKLIDLTATQSPDIAQAVHVNKAEDELGAGDQVGIIWHISVTWYMHAGC